MASTALSFMQALLARLLNTAAPTTTVNSLLTSVCTVLLLHLSSADTPEDAKVAIANGAQGIGLTRTEHMFFATHQRIAAVRRMIAAVELGSPAAAEALKELQGYQTQVRD
jgi:hypothetical protein